jgi:hypothetical protein
MARSGGFWAGVVFGGAAIGAVIGTAYFVANNHPVTHDEMCTVTAKDGSTYVRTAEAASNAALVAAGAQKFDLGTNASTVAVATAIQESGLRNLDYGDRDSLGLFQQRPSQGWGTVEEVTDPYFATRTFYRRLEKVEGWEAMRVTEAAQAVQKSGFPEAYEEHAPEAAAWAEAVRGDTAFASVNCDLSAVDVPSSADDLATRIRRDWGVGVYTVTVLGRNDRAVLVGVTADSGEAAELEGLANWAVAVADPQAIASVRLGDIQWLREQGIAPNTQQRDYDGVMIGVVTSLPSD